MLDFGCELPLSVAVSYVLAKLIASVSSSVVLIETVISASSSNKSTSTIKYSVAETTSKLNSAATPLIITVKSPRFKAKASLKVTIRSLESVTEMWNDTCLISREHSVVLSVYPAAHSHVKSEVRLAPSMHP